MKRGELLLGLFARSLRHDSMQDIPNPYREEFFKVIPRFGRFVVGVGRHFQ
jgi:hypothetical protein